MNSTKISQLTLTPEVGSFGMHHIRNSHLFRFLSMLQLSMLALISVAQTALASTSEIKSEPTDESPEAIIEK